MEEEVDKTNNEEVEQTKTNAVSEEEVDQIEDAIKTIESKAAQYVANKKKTALDRHELMSLINQKLTTVNIPIEKIKV
jgi:outer membrane protein TolC